MKSNHITLTHSNLCPILGRDRVPISNLGQDSIAKTYVLVYFKCIIYDRLQTLQVQTSLYCVECTTSVYWFCPPTSEPSRCGEVHRCFALIRQPQ